MPREWQLDAAEALILGLDTFIVAGTGSGKTIPYMLPLLLPENRRKMIVVISPLKALQRDQVCFHEMMSLKLRDKQLNVGICM